MVRRITEREEDVPESNGKNQLESDIRKLRTSQWTNILIPNRKEWKRVAQQARNNRNLSDKEIKGQYSLFK